MTSLRRLLAALLIGGLGLLPAAVPAQAADASAANKAAHWLTTQVSGGALDAGFGKASGTADGLIGLASATDPALQTTIDTLLTTLKADASAYAYTGKPPAADAAAAGKLAIVAAAFALNPASFGGVDLVTAMTSGIAADGSVLPYPSAFSSGSAMAGLDRAGVARPASLTTWLAAHQNSDGGWGYADGQPSDADNTALGITGLLTDKSNAAQTALAKAIAWATKNQHADGSWDGYVPVNSTCVMGSALVAAGRDETKATTFVVGKQLANGAITDGSGANLMATSQCIPLLGGVSYLNVAWTPKAQTVATTTSSSTATSTTTPAPAAATTTTTSSSTASRGVPARTGADDELPLLPLGLVAAAVVVVAGVAARARRR